MAFCPQCGTDNPDTATYCAGCGFPMTATPHTENSTPAPEYSTGYEAPVYTPVPTTPPISYPTSVSASTLPVGANVTSIISMVCGILSCVSVYVGFIFAIPAIILAAISKSKTPSDLSNGKATAGLVTGIIGIILSILWIIIFVAIFAEVSSYSYNSYDYYY